MTVSRQKKTDFQKNVTFLKDDFVCCLTLKHPYSDALFFLALFVRIVVFKTKLFKVDWSGSARLLREQRDR
ncbi:hypothetical protein BKC07_23565 [Peribacillus simplex]|nr:hypothetical protein BKC07_23565 [Peribacillus simplex]